MRIQEYEDFLRALVDKGEDALAERHSREVIELYLGNRLLAQLGGRQIVIIKRIRAATGLGLREALRHTDRYSLRLMPYFPILTHHMERFGGRDLGYLKYFSYEEAQQKAADLGGRKVEGGRFESPKGKLWQMSAMSPKLVEESAVNYLLVAGGHLRLHELNTKRKNGYGPGWDFVGIVKAQQQPDGLHIEARIPTGLSGTRVTVPLRPLPLNILDYL